MGLYINNFYGVTWYKHNWYVKGHNCIVVSSIKPSEIGVVCSPTYLSFAGPGREKNKTFFFRISWGKLSPKILIEHGANNEEKIYTGDPAVMALNGEISLDLMGISLGFHEI